MIKLALALLLTAPTGINTNQIRTAQPNVLDVTGVTAADGNVLDVARADHGHAVTGTLQQSHGGTGAGSVVCPAGQVLTSSAGVVSCVSAGISAYARASAPTCDASQVSKEIRVHDTGQADETWVCELRDTTYAWTVYSQAPNSTAQVMADGTGLVTVGGVVASVGDRFLSSAVPAYGAPTATVLVDAQYGSRMASYFAVGSTKKFSRIYLNVRNPPKDSTYLCTGASYTHFKYLDGGWTQGGLNWTPSTLEASNGWFNYGVPALLQQSGTVPTCGNVTVTKATTGTFGSSTGTPWGADTGVTQFLTWRPFGVDGYIEFTGANVNWTKGWSCLGYGSGYGTAAPTGINANDYYWVVFSVLTDWTVHSCSTDPTAGTCGSFLGGNVYRRGDNYSPLVIYATSVE